MVGSSGKNGKFATTRWSLILRARKPTPESREALATLCKLYWDPLHEFVCRGYPKEDAKDLTQEFFARLLARDDLSSFDQNKGRFRSWLLGSMKHFLANEWDRRRAQKHGGGAEHVPLDVDDASPADPLDPEKLYNLKWVMSVVGQALHQLEAVYERRGQSERFKLLKDSASGEGGPQAEMATALDREVNAVKQMIFRFKGELAVVIRAVVADTVEHPEDDAEIDAEISELLATLDES